MDGEPCCWGKEWEGLDDRGGSSGGICDVITLVPTAETWKESNFSYERYGSTGRQRYQPVWHNFRNGRF
jgi:hypothetical protein